MFAVFNRLSPSPWFRKPEADLREVEVCKDDGYLPAGGCETEMQLGPAGSHFEIISPNHRVVHLDAKPPISENSRQQLRDLLLAGRARNQRWIP